MSPALAGGFFTTSITWEAPARTMSTFLKLLATLRTAVTRLKSHTRRAKIQIQLWLQNLYILLFWSSWPSRSPESERRRGGRTAKWWLMWAPQSVSQGFHLRLHVLAIYVEQVNFVFCSSDISSEQGPRIPGQLAHNRCQPSKNFTAPSSLWSLPWHTQKLWLTGCG